MKKGNILDLAEIRDVITNSDYCWLGYYQGIDRPSLELVNFTYEETNEGYIFSITGQGLSDITERLRKNNNVSLGFDLQTNEGVETVIVKGWARITQARYQRFHREAPDALSVSVTATDILGERFIFS